MDFPAESIMQMTLAALPDVNISLSRWLRRRGNRMEVGIMKKLIFLPYTHWIT